MIGLLIAGKGWTIFLIVLAHSGSLTKASIAMVLGILFSFTASV